MPSLHKYPRTHHLEGSWLQPGDEDSQSIPFAALAGRFLVIEEKLDGVNAGISFDEVGQLWLQSRGHFLTGGPREKHFNLSKRWAHTHADALRGVLGWCFVLYSEWLHAKHTIFYNRLPHYFLEFDILDTETGVFLSTDKRRVLLDGTPIPSVPVLRSGAVRPDGRSVHQGRRAGAGDRALQVYPREFSDDRAGLRKPLAAPADPAQPTGHGVDLFGGSP